MDDARGNEEPDAAEAWRDVTVGFVDLGTRLRTFFEGAPDTNASDEIRTASVDFSESAKRLGVLVTNAFEDTGVQEGAKKAIGTLIDAIGLSVRQAGSQYQWGASTDDTSDDSTGEASS
jgi:hypothetical protein